MDFSTLLNNFRNNVTTFIKKEDDIMDDNLISDIQSEVDKSTVFVKSIGKVASELSDNDINNIEKNLNNTLQKIYEIVDERKKPLSPQQLSISMLSISKKLDKIMKNQADEKEKLTKIELDIKNIEADSLKNYLTQPFVPKEDLKIIYTAAREEFSIILTALKTQGFQPFIDKYGPDFMKDINKTLKHLKSEKRLSEVIFEVENTSLLLIQFLEDVDDWNGIDEPMYNLRGDMTYEQLKGTQYVLSDIDRRITGEGQSYFSKKLKNILVPYTQDRELPMLLQYLRKAGVNRERTEGDYKRTNRYKEEYYKIKKERNNCN